MVEIINKQIIVNGKARLIMSGEVHYFRLQREEWQGRIDKLKAAGCNTVASYVPWLCHEAIEGQVDLDGRTRPELDLGAFIDLCRDNGLWFFVRPGPFIMAEMKNEGLPYWLYEKHPEIVPVGWDAKPATTPTVDYLAAGFLVEVRRWYAAVMGVIAPRLEPEGGNIIAVQLDNEIGMLSWVSNCPELTDQLLTDFVDWLRHKHGDTSLQEHYPFDLGDKLAMTKGIRSPDASYSVKLMHDLGHFMRNRYVRYVATLRAWAEGFGVVGIPFIVNIHGTGGGRGFTFPIGISQLYQSYTQAPGYLSGSDYYFGNLSFDNFQDLYICNAFMASVHRPEQPLTSVEFECGDGNYGNNLGNRQDPSSINLKIRMCLAQGNRLINFYLFSGGHNYHLKPEPKDDNGRIALTGERHGIAAPVGPEGKLNYTYPFMARTIKTAMAVSDKLATMEEEHDRVALAFIPDYYITEYRYPGNDAMREICANLEAYRGFGAWEIMVRAMLQSGFRFGAVDIQNRQLDPSVTPVLALGSARYMAAEIQHKLSVWMAQGGSLLLYGEVPRFDMDGRVCLLLANALGVQLAGDRLSKEHRHLSVLPDGWAAPRPEVRTHYAQTFHAESAQPLFRLYGSDEVCGFEAKVGNGRVIVIATAYECDLALFSKALERLGAVAGLTHDCPDHGIFMTSTSNREGERFVHLLNLDAFDKAIRLNFNGKKLLGGRKISLQARDGLMLPFDMAFHDVIIRYSSAELTCITRNSLHFRLTQTTDFMLFETTRKVIPDVDYCLQQHGNSILLISRKNARLDDKLTVRFR